MQIFSNTYNNVTNLNSTTENRPLNGSAQQIQGQERTVNVTTSQQKIEPQNQAVPQNRNFNTN